MCGICGYLAGGEAARRAPSEETLRAMNETLVHRGPDSGGHFRDAKAGVGLAARRLSIIDLAGGDQPIAIEDGAVQVVQNGEIYNHVALRAELEREGHAFRTRSDTEVLARAYLQYGVDFVERLRGMFAVALWDAPRRRLVLARDRLGVKPLYYRHADGVLTFASELKAMLADPSLHPELDREALGAYLSFNSIPAPHTIFRGVHKLPAAHRLVLEASTGAEPVIERYWRVELPPREAARRDQRSLDELCEELRAVLRDSVRSHLVSDVPVGVLLSGGVDSSTLVALASEQSGEPVRTFSIGFEESSFNELDDARRVARRYGTDHHELVVRPDAVELLPRLVECFDEPFADSSAVPTYLVSQLAAGEVKVALSGEGGDEVFAGYYTYLADKLAPAYARLPAALRERTIRPLVERLPSSARRASLDYMAKRFVGGAALGPLERHHAWKVIFSESQKAELLARPPAGGDPVEFLRRSYERSAGAEQLSRLQLVDLEGYLCDDLLVKVDRTSMAHSLEARVPLLDHRLVEFAAAVPASAKLRGVRKKYLLRKAMEPLLPRPVTHGRKRGFSIPAAAWLRGPLREFTRESLSAPTLERQGVFRPGAVATLLATHEQGRADLSRQIWCILMFTLWHERYLGAARPAAEAAALAG